ncbi:unnamed protein product [Hyaloperonospora brassicae]|uniref:FYVE-type domain-containing protein n=1 Tax=Hyaloperonospora brassicae TaxID=162125 RepID=A0AAV0TCF1_HYABA|nr:unnamed protein product [Hyaloperonospora brassicae]
MSHRFPLPSLPPLHLSALERRASREFMQLLLAHTLREFEGHTYGHGGVADTRRWKPHTQRDDLTVFRERSAGRTGRRLLTAARRQHCCLELPLLEPTVATLSSPTLLLTGVRRGRVEDAMSAVVTESQQDFALAVTYKHTDVADCAILETLEPPRPAAPYHYLGLKFFVRRSPTEGHVLKHRHSIYLEFSGLATSSRGEVVGFHLMHSVALAPGAAFPDLRAFNSIRALQSTRYVYRQKTDALVDVFMVGNMDIAGRVVRPLATRYAIETVVGVTRLLALAEVRRLSQMAHAQRTFGTWATAVADGRGTCHVCATAAGAKRKTLQHCVLCGHAVCRACTTAKRVFQSDDSGILGAFEKVAACTQCVQRANTGAFLTPHERVRRTPVKELPGAFQKPMGRPSGPLPMAEMEEMDRCGASGRSGSGGPRRETFPSASSLGVAPDVEQHRIGQSLPTTSLLNGLDDDELDGLDSFLENRPRPVDPTTTTTAVVGTGTAEATRPQRGCCYAVVDESSRPRPLLRASDARVVYNLLPSKGHMPHRKLELPSNASAAQRSMMVRLLELSKIAEDTSATARRNRLYCEQYWREELEKEGELIRRTQC